MKDWFAGLVAPSALLLTLIAAQAQETVDVAKITCDQFRAGKITDSRTMSIWLSGYYHGVRNNAVVDVSALQKYSDDLVDYCFSHRNVTIMDAVRNLDAAKKPSGAAVR